MNLPNKLTTLRVIMIPFFVFFLLWQNGENHTFRMIALALFIIASLTDLLDGKIARKYNLVTNFGKFMDPLADKLLVCSALICLIELNALPAWMVIIIISFYRQSGNSILSILIDLDELQAVNHTTVITECILLALNCLELACIQIT